MPPFTSRACTPVLPTSGTALHAQVPQIINRKGRAATGVANFKGTGQFKPMVVNGACETSIGTGATKA